MKTKFKSRVAEQRKQEELRNKHLREIVGKRKHGSHLDVGEEATLWKRLKSIQEWEWQMTDHALDRITEKGILATKRDIISAINHSSIVEYKVDQRGRNSFDERVVLASKALVNENYRMKAVYSLKQKSIVSVWLNHIDDSHATLDWSLYDKNIKIPLQ